MSIQANFPAIKPTLLLDFANTEALDPRITFTRASTGTYYDGKTVAKAEENLLTYSQEFDNAAWTPAGTVTSNVTLAPDGTLTADRCAVVSGAALSQIVNGITAGINYTISVWAKSSATGGASNVRITTNNTGAWNTGVSQIYALTSEWQRITISGAIISSGTSVRLMIGAYTVGGGGDATCAGNIDVWGAQLEQRASATAYTPTTTQAVTTYIPVLQTAASGVPRFEHNPVTGESLGLEIEEQRTNLVTYSEQFDNGAWAKGAATVTTNIAIAPDGTLTADKLAENTANAFHNVYVNRSCTVGEVLTRSVYVKAGERTWAGLYVQDGAGVDFFAYLNLSTGVLGTVSAGVTASVQNVGNGWYRFSVTRTVAATFNSAVFSVFPTTGDNTVTYTGNGFSGIYIWGAQLEAGAFPTSYIPTVASQVTRAADSAVMTGANFSSWYRPDEGSLFGEFSQYSSASPNNQWVAALTDGTTNNYIGALTNPSSYRCLIVSGGATQASIINGTVTANTSTRGSLAYKANDFAATSSGAVSIGDTSGVVPMVSQFTIGSVNSGSPINGTIRKIAYYPVRVTNAQLQALTS